MTQPPDAAADADERRSFFSAMNAGYARLQADPTLQSELDAERDDEAHALADRSR